MKTCELICKSLIEDTFVEILIRQVETLVKLIYGNQLNLSLIFSSLLGKFGSAILILSNSIFSAVSNFNNMRVFYR